MNPNNEDKHMPLILDGKDLQENRLSENLSKQEMTELMDYQTDEDKIRVYRVMDGIMNHR